MRLWHYKLISSLPRQWILGQHREVCALKGLGWGKPHSVVNYVFKHPYAMLHNYHCIVMNEMMCREYSVNYQWFDIRYRGKIFGYDYSDFTNPLANVNIMYPEHNQIYLQECIDNLLQKGVKCEILL